MKSSYKTNILFAIKSLANHQIENALNGKCAWWSYEPKMPTALKKKMANKDTVQLRRNK